MQVEVTQFLRPNGNRKQVLATLPDELAEQVALIKDCCCIFTAEVLTNDMVSVCISWVDGDYKQFCCPNSEEVAVKFAKMVKEFDAADFKLWKEGLECVNT